MTQRRSVPPEILDEIVRRVVQVARPEKIILFGSAARGEIGRNSDIDLLIVVRGPVDRRRLSAAIHANLRGIGEAVDAVVVTTEAVERYKDSHPLVIKPALREGRVLYEGPAGCRPPTEFRLDVEEPMAAGRFEPDDPREWLNRARSNLAMARAKIPEAYLEDLCFEAQQAAEKAIKAVLIKQGVEFPYVHDLQQLLPLVERHGEQIAQPLWAAERLGRFAWEDRYPGRLETTQEEYRELLAIAEDVVQWAEARIT